MQSKSSTHATSQDYYNFSQHFTNRPAPKEQSGVLNKENKLQNLLAAVELNRTAVVDQRRATQKDHYQSHREFGRDISNSTGTQQAINTKVINPTNSTTN